MFQSPGQDVEVAVHDRIVVARDGSVVANRLFHFETDSTAPRRIEYVRRECLGAPVSPRGRRVRGAVATLRLYESQPPGNSERFVWELDAEVTADAPVSVEITAPLLGPNSKNPLQYELYFDSHHGVTYTLRVTPPFPELTIPERTEFKGSPAEFAECLERSDAGHLLTTPLRVSSNRTGPVRAVLAHGYDLRTTKLMKHYAEKFQQ